MSENRRRGARHARPEQHAPQEEVAPQQHLPPPPPMTIEQMFLMQTQAVQAIGQWSSEVAVANATAELPPLRVPAALAEHASHLCACSQTSVETTHISDLTLQSYSIRKDV